MSGAPARGTTPPGAAGEQEAARWVRLMFGRVAGRYDLLNHLLSFQIDRYWRARTVRRLRPLLHRPEARILDLCCGTGDLLLALDGESSRPVFGSDFCHPMLLGARRKIAARHLVSPLVEADALALPFPDHSLDVIAVAFGFRNLANYEKGLIEMRRALKPGGAAAILEFSQPRNRLFAALYRFYSNRLLPAVGGLISGDRSAYRYLPESVRRFPGPAELAADMRAAGFGRVEYELMTGGVVALHIGYGL